MRSNGGDDWPDGSWKPRRGDVGAAAGLRWVQAESSRLRSRPITPGSGSHPGALSKGIVLAPIWDLSGQFSSGKGAARVGGHGIPAVQKQCRLDAGARGTAE